MEGWKDVHVCCDTPSNYTVIHRINYHVIAIEAHTHTERARDTNKHIHPHLIRNSFSSSLNIKMFAKHLIRYVFSHSFIPFSLCVSSILFLLFIRLTAVNLVRLLSGSIGCFVIACASNIDSQIWVSAWNAWRDREKQFISITFGAIYRYSECRAPYSFFALGECVYVCEWACVYALYVRTARTF